MRTEYPQKGMLHHIAALINLSMYNVEDECNNAFSMLFKLRFVNDNDNNIIYKIPMDRNDENVFAFSVNFAKQQDNNLTITFSNNWSDVKPCEFQVPYSAHLNDYALVPILYSKLERFLMGFPAYEVLKSKYGKIIMSPFDTIYYEMYD